MTLDWLEWSLSFSKAEYTAVHPLFAPLAYALPLPSFGGLKFAFTEYTGKERVLAERLVRRPLLKPGPARPFPPHAPPLTPSAPPQVTTLGGEVTDAFSRDNSYLCALYQRGPKVEKARQWQQRRGWPGHVVRLRWLYDCARHGVLPMGPQYDPPPPPPPPPDGVDDRRQSHDGRASTSAAAGGGWRDAARDDRRQSHDGSASVSSARPSAAARGGV